MRSSFHTTIRVLEGLLAYERATGGPPPSAAARRRGEEYLLERRLLRRRSTGEFIDPDFLQFSFPTRWHYDVLRGLEHFRSTGDRPDHAPGRGARPGPLQAAARRHLAAGEHLPGPVHFTLEDGDGRPSRWNTLRALRVLRWDES